NSTICRNIPAVAFVSRLSNPTEAVPMNFLEALSIAGRAIWAHKLRSFLTLLGTIVAVASVIFVVSLIEGFNRYVAEKIADMGSNAFVVTRYGIITSLKEFKEKEKYNHWLTLDELEAIRTDAH